MGPQAVITHIANRGAHVDNALGDGGVTPHSLSARAFASFADDAQSCAARGALDRSRSAETSVRMDQQARQRGGWSWWYLLLLVQFVAVLWPPFYNRVEPSLVGLPFFYWYQLLWVILGAILTAIVYFATKD